MISVAFVAAALIAVIFVDTFETTDPPVRVRHAYRLARMYYFTAWLLWRSTVAFLPSARLRQSFLSIFGPLSLLGLVFVWAAGLILVSRVSLVARHGGQFQEQRG